MDRFEREYLDTLQSNVKRAEENLRNADVESVDSFLNAFIEAKEDYVNYKRKFNL